MLKIFLGLLALVGAARASHFRYGHLTWAQTGTRTAKIDVAQAWRRDYSSFESQCGSWFWGDDCEVGDVVETGVLQMPNGSPSSRDVDLYIAVIDAANNYFIGSYSTTTTFNTNGPIQISFYTCCRLGGIKNAPAELPTTSTVKFVSGRVQSSPVSSVPPIVQMQQNRLNKFNLPVADSDFDLVKFSRYAIGNGAGTINSLTIDAVSGEIQWNPGSSATGYYTVVIKMEDYDNRYCSPPVTACSGSHKLSDVMVDFFINVVPNDGKLPPVFVSPTPADGSTISAAQGETVTFPIKVTDQDNDQITLQASWSTSGMAFTGATSARGTLNSGFRWTVPTGAAANAANQACFVARDPTYESQLHCVTIKVGTITVTNVVKQGTSSSTGYADGGDLLSVTGKNFGGGSNYKCRFVPPQTSLPSITVSAQYISVTEIRCTTPNVRTNPGEYRVEASKDGNGFTDDRKTFTFVSSCPPSVTNMCSGHGTCNNGVCQCNSPWKGDDCSARCGNGVLEAGEQCDDGDTSNGDGCSSSCSRESGWTCNSASPSVCQKCGNGIKEGTESCDDGNTSGGDGCSSSCARESGWTCSNASPNVCQKCGNGKKEGTEQCDDGDLSNGDGCSSTCTKESGWTCNNASPTVCQKCGNSRREGTEQCDDGDLSNGDGCSSTCTTESGWTCSNGIPNVCQKCGNGRKEGSEGCDDGNTSGGDGCSASCSTESGWICNNGIPNVCQKCGNGIREGTEQCDDGDLTSGDGCSSSCVVESGYTCSTASPNVCQKCGNGRVEGTENCDDGNTNSGDGCNGSCKKESGWTCSSATPNVCQKCGNGIKEGTEACDDGNLVGNPKDGCSATCVVDSGWSCNNASPNVCQKCGNGVREGTERNSGMCDDGNTSSGDGCSSSCTVESGWTCAGNTQSTCQRCGNGVKEGTETCDDGNTSGGDGCSATCARESGWTCSNASPNVCQKCGNGIKEGTEQCDDGDTSGGDGCSATCATESGWTCSNASPNVCQKCGNGIREGTETCDDGNTASSDGCSNTCAQESGWTCNDPATPAGAPDVCQRCGNGVIEGTETCDDGNTASSDGCNASCAPESGWTCNGGSPTVCQKCGNGIREGTEECDDGNLVGNPKDGCSSTCVVDDGWNCDTTVSPNTCANTPALCGNSAIDGAEQCDDGNKVSGDGCSYGGCAIEPGWTCGAALPNVCQKCGNGIREGTEQCDDGNTASNDGCSATCATESGWTCNDPATPPHADDVCQKCGNGVIEGTEVCDDNNVANGDGCSNTCAKESGWTCNGAITSVCEKCGNGIREGGESCDDGNTANGDGCSSTCAPESGWTCNDPANPPSANDVCEKCGNGIVEGGEACDDGNVASGDGCSATCTQETSWTCAGAPSVCQRCGNGIREGTEAVGTGCDDGNLNSGDGCSSTCARETGWTCNDPATPPEAGDVCEKCGNGVREGSETGAAKCDDGNTNPGDGCDATCNVEAGWTCNGDTGSVCQICGNGIREGTEGCDDSNTTGNDGCSATCAIESGWFCTDPAGAPADADVCEKCGNGVIEGGEVCDDGNVASGDGCDSACAVETGYTCRTPGGGGSSICKQCGNGLREDDEQCDDANLVGGDGCAGNCTVEAGWTCTFVAGMADPDVCEICGNGVREGAETCDDGNTVGGDGCSASMCQIEPGFTCDTSFPNICQNCGNGKLEGTEQCDDAANVDGDGCDATCAIEPGYVCSAGDMSVCQNCGNGRREGSEQCDDGNVDAEDGCSGSCTVEPKWECLVARQTANGTDVCNLIFVPPLTPGTVLNLDPLGVFPGDRRSLPQRNAIKASWTGFFWPDRYEYKVGTYPGGDDVLNFTESANGGKATEMLLEGVTLTHDLTYYVTVRSWNNETTPRASIGVSPGVTIDATPPTGGVVVDGAKGDVLWTPVPTNASFYYTPFADPESGISSVEWCMGSEPNACDIIPPTAVANVSAAEVHSLTGLPLLHNKHYYFSVNASNGLGVVASRVSNGFGVDLVAPDSVGVNVYNGKVKGEHVPFWGEPNAVRANWGPSPFTDEGSGLQRIEWAIGTTPGGTDIQVWTDIGLATEVVREELASSRENGTFLQHGKTYYTSVRAFDYVGKSTEVRGDPFTVDLTPPIAGVVNDGVTPLDEIDIHSRNEEVTLNWESFDDPESGIVRYEVALGTGPTWNGSAPVTDGGDGTSSSNSSSNSNTDSGNTNSANSTDATPAYGNTTDVVGWTDVGTAPSYTFSGLQLVNGSTYYVSVRAINGANLVSQEVTSDGFIVVIGTDSGSSRGSVKDNDSFLGSAAGKGLIGAGVATAAVLGAGVAGFLALKSMKKRRLRQRTAAAREARKEAMTRQSSLAADNAAFEVDMQDGDGVEMGDIEVEVEGASAL